MLVSIKRREKVNKIKQQLYNLSTNQSCKKLKKKSAVVVRNPTTIVSIIYGQLQCLVRNDFNTNLKQYLINNNIVNNDVLFGESFGCTYGKNRQIVFIVKENEMKSSVTHVQSNVGDGGNEMSEDDSEYEMKSDHSSTKVYLPEIVSSHKTLYEQRKKFLELEWNPCQTFGSKELFDISDYNHDDGSVYPESVSNVFENVSNVSHAFENVSSANYSRTMKNRHRRRSSIIQIPGTNIMNQMNSNENMFHNKCMTDNVCHQCCNSNDMNDVHMYNNSNNFSVDDNISTFTAVDSIFNVSVHTPVSISLSIPTSASTTPSTIYSVVNNVQHTNIPQFINHDVCTDMPDITYHSVQRHPPINTVLPMPFYGSVNGYGGSSYMYGNGIGSDVYSNNLVNNSNYGGSGGGNGGGYGYCNNNNNYHNQF